MHLTPEELAKELASNENIKLIDVCEPYEYGTAHIRNAVNIPLTGLKLNLENILPDLKPEDRIVVYCAHGVRSRNAAKDLWDMGYKNVSSLMGGLANWQEHGYEITR